MHHSIIFLILIIFMYSGSALSKESQHHTINFDKVKRSCKFAKVEANLEDTRILKISVPKSVSKNMNMVRCYIKLKNPSGYLLLVEGEFRIANVSRPRHSYNGAKCQIRFKNKDKWIHRGVLGHNKKYGTKGWKYFFRTVLIPAGVESLVLEMGLQDSSGTIFFRNVQYSQDGKAPKSLLAQNPIPQMKYSYKYMSHRGVVSSHYFKEEDFADLKKWNGNLIRWQLSRVPLKSNCTLEQWVKMIKEKVDNLGKVLDAGKKYDIKVIVDLHSSLGRPFLCSKKGQQYFIEIWKKIATKYKGHPAIYGYDLLNEPNSKYLGKGLPSWPELAQKAIRVIRAIDPKVPIIVESDRTSSPVMLQYLPKFNTDNIIYSIHVYNPGSLTHQLNRKQKSFLGYPDKEWNRKTAIVDFLQPARDFQLRTGARIYVGEFSCARWVPGAAEYIKDCTDVFDKYGWDWTYHSYRESDVWSVEHDNNPNIIKRVPTTDRKEVLLNAFSRNSKISKKN